MMSREKEEMPELKSQKVPEPQLIDVLREIKTLQKDLATMTEAVKALGKEVINSNSQTQAALTDLALKMGDLQGAYIKTLSNKKMSAASTKSHMSTQKSGSPTKSLQGQFDPTDLMEHKWKGRKQGEGNYSVGSLSYGWDFADQFKPETIKALELGPLTVDKYVFKFTGKIVQTKKAE